MPNNYFQFKKFMIRQDKCAMKVCTDSCLFGAWIASKLNAAGNLSALDIGGGTGLLSLMIAQKSDADIDAIEINRESAEQMTENFVRSPWKNRLHAVHGDIREFGNHRKYDLIISNPPFYENELKSDDKEKSIARHDSGLLLAELVTSIIKNLDPEGLFYIMIPAYREEYLTGQLTGKGFIVTEKLIVRHSRNHPPFRTIFQGCRKTNVSSPLRNELIIYGEDGYTANFKNLLHDYYLHL